MEKRAQWVDHFSVVKGSHQFKTGVDIIGSWRFVTFFNNFPGTYTFAQGARTPFNASDPATFPFQYTQNFGGSGLNFKDAMAGVFVQDDWEVRRGLTLNVGVRWDRDSLFQGDNNNFAPRAGFAWNVGGDARTVVRGNTGIFYDTLESSAINRESNTGPVGQTTIDLRQGDPLFPTFPNRLSAFPTGADDGRAGDGLRAGLRRRRLPLQHRRRVQAAGAVLLQHQHRRAARARTATGRCPPTTPASTATTCW